jgi:hypothetical protein
MPIKPKRERSITIRLSDHEAATLSRLVGELGMESSEILRVCLALGIPILKSVPFARRIVLEDNLLLRENPQDKS